jgi:hypothetical protein
MKRVGIWAIGIGLVVIVGLLTLEQGYAKEEDDGPTCTLKTLKGRYLFGNTATTLLAPDDPDPLAKQQLVAIAGFHTFNGDGTGTDMVTLTINGVLVRENFVTPITYTVNPDCSGTITILATGESIGIFIAPNGEELMTILRSIPGLFLGGSQTPTIYVALLFR